MLAAARVRAGWEIVHKNKLNIAPGFDDLAGNLVPKNQPGLRGRPSSHHMLITAANVGAHDFQNHAVVTLFAPRIDQLRKVDAAYLHFAGADVNYSAIACHVSLLR